MPTVKIDTTEPLEVVERIPKRSLVTVGLNLNAVTTTGAGSSIYTGASGQVTWVVRVASVTTGGTVLIQGCEKDSGVSTDWYTLATVTVSASGTQYVAVLEDELHLYMRSNVSARTDGTYTTTILARPAVGVDSR